MSDSQDKIILQQNQVQQRQILALMGINQWVRPDSSTIDIANIDSPVATVEQQLVSDAIANRDVDTIVPMQNIVTTEINVDIGIETNQTLNDSVIPNSTIMPDDSLTDIAAIDDSADANDDISQSQPVTYEFDRTNSSTSPSNNRPVAQAIEPLVEQLSANNLVTVAPFDLQGARYGNWILLVDIQALNNDSQKLWHNMTEALSLTYETSSFPICAGMDTAELANASFAGYLFKIARSEDIKVAALTPLPEGLTHPNLASVPTLEDMLTDSMQKRHLWELISY